MANLKSANESEPFIEVLLNSIVDSTWSQDVFSSIANKLLELGYNGRQTDTRSSTLLHYAVKYGFADMVKCITSHFVDIDIKDTIISVPLHVERKVGNTIFDESKCTDSNLIKMVNKQDNAGRSPLYYAAERKDYNISCMLVLHGANVGSITTEKQKELLIYSANETHGAKTNDHKWRPVVSLLAIKVPDAVLDFSTGYEYPRLLSYFCRHGHTKVIDALLNAVKDKERRKEIVNHGDNSTTPLNWANATANTVGLSDQDHLKTVKCLMGHGATKLCNDVDHIYSTLQSASHWGHMETFKHYVDQANKKDFNTYIGLATIGNHMQMVKYIWQNYREYTTDHVGNTALHYATWRGGMPSIIYLCENGADINATNETGETPMKLALEGRRRDVVAYLISKLKNC